MLVTTAFEVLEDCLGVTSLAIWISPISAMPVLMQEHINALPLRKFSLNHMSSMFSTSPLTSPLFIMLDMAWVITHLEILEGWTLSTEMIGIEALTQLTHLSLPLSLNLSRPKYLQKFLHHCANLEVIILCSRESQNDINAWLQVHDIRDIRTVWTDESPWCNWCPLNSNHRNLWDCGEDMVAWWCRKKGMCQDIQLIEY